MNTNTINIKNTLLLGLGLVILTAGFIAYSVPHKAKAADNQLALCSSGGLNQATSTQSLPTPSNLNGTSTPISVSLSSTGATTTVICDIGSTNSYDVNVYAIASSSLATLIYTQQFGTDLPTTLFNTGDGSLSSATTSPTMNQVDWYYESCLSDVQSNTTRPHGYICTHSLSLATSTNPTGSNYVRSNMQFSTPAERFLRIDMNTTGSTTAAANALVNLKIVKRINNNY